MEVKLSGNFKAIIPRTKKCRDFLKDFSTKNTTDRKNAVVTKTIEGKRQRFGTPIAKQPYVLKKVSKHFTPS